ncbi:flagellar assembly protein FliW [Clostridium putrefaciens]|uniref:Flagellar assembly factor FliW n=1 Tax=Clostridium putrefaciens TaxID=99675 RepID=A0A381JAU7_9CLOT|nr:flagellar assembly protein FliW [Clostridium putrefaciens]SUY47502.1 flagellar assembly protein FliW [Clostridium putrefaciens]
MEVKTKYHGTVSFQERDIIKFNKGLPAFESLKNFILLSVDGSDIFKILHSIEDEEIGLIVVSPFEFIKEYEVELSDEIIDKLSIKKEEDVLILNTVTLNSDVSKITANLRAPIIINIKESLGEQIILEDENFSIKYPIIRE